MTKPEILKWLQELENIKHDPEQAHSLQDEIYEAFIEYVAERKDDLGRKAKLILKTNDIDFNKFYS